LYASPALFAQAFAKLETSSAGAAGQPVPRFFAATQMAALRRLGEIIMPAIGNAPGAKEAGAAEFLDFLVGESPVAVRTLYRSGLDALNTRAAAKYRLGFAALDDTRADALLGPLREAWTWKEPADPFAVFLRHAKADILTATTNSRGWVIASGRGGNGTYWIAPE
jgi:hypothetical protein